MKRGAVRYVPLLVGITCIALLILVGRQASEALGAFPWRLLDRGHDHMRAGEHDLAIADFTEAIRLEPDTRVNYRGPDAIRFDVPVRGIYQERGDAYVAKGEYDQAIADYTEAIRLSPTVAGDAYYRRADAYKAKDEQDHAAADYAKAKDLGYHK